MRSVTCLRRWLHDTRGGHWNPRNLAPRAHIAFLTNKTPPLPDADNIVIINRTRKEEDEFTVRRQSYFRQTSCSCP